MQYLHWSIYYGNNKLLIPTNVKTAFGVRMSVEPMELVDVNDASELKRTMLTMVAKGNPVVPHPSQEEMSKITLHKNLGFRSYKAFNQFTSTWSLDYTDGIYEIIFLKVPENGRGFVSDPSKTISFPAGTSVETVVGKLTEIIQETHKQKSRKNYGKS